jgi:hypothetical protein
MIVCNLYLSEAFILPEAFSYIFNCVLSLVIVPSLLFIPLLPFFFYFLDGPSYFV